MSLENANKDPLLRFAVYSKKAGVYLGDGHWGNRNPGDRTSVPTFTRPEAEATIKNLKNDDLDDLKMMMVFPDQGTQASISACNSAGIPLWTPTPK